MSFLLFKVDVIDMRFPSERHTEYLFYNLRTSNNRKTTIGIKLLCLHVLSRNKVKEYAFTKISIRFETILILVVVFLVIYSEKESLHEPATIFI